MCIRDRTWLQCQLHRTYDKNAAAFSAAQSTNFVDGWSRLYLCSLSALLPRLLFFGRTSRTVWPSSSEQLRTSRRRCAWLEHFSPTGTRTDSAYRNLSAYLRNVFLVFHLQPERGCCYQSGIFTKTDSPLNLQSDQRKNGKQNKTAFRFSFVLLIFRRILCK